jgi:hypothetical protein
MTSSRASNYVCDNPVMMLVFQHFSGDGISWIWNLFLCGVLEFYEFQWYHLCWSSGSIKFLWLVSMERETCTVQCFASVYLYEIKMFVFFSFVCRTKVAPFLSFFHTFGLCLGSDPCKYRAFVNTVMNLLVLWKAENFLTWATISFSRITVLYSIELFCVSTFSFEKGSAKRSFRNTAAVCFKNLCAVCCT